MKKYVVKFPVDYNDLSKGYYYDDDEDCNVMIYDNEEVAFARHREKGLPENEADKTLVVHSIGVCKKCGSPLFPSDSYEYTSQCFTCDEDFYGIEQTTTLDVQTAADEKKLYLTTVQQLARMVCDKIPKGKINVPLRLFSFAVIDPDFTDKKEPDFEYIKSTATGWYGITRIDTKFDSDQLTLCTDYYGGGCQKFCVIDEEDTDTDRVVKIMNAIICSLQIGDGDFVNGNTLLLAEDDFYDDASTVYIVYNEEGTQAIFSKSEHTRARLIFADKADADNDFQRLMSTGRLKRIHY